MTKVIFKCAKCKEIKTEHDSDIGKRKITESGKKCKECKNVCKNR